MKWLLLAAITFSFAVGPPSPPPPPGWTPISDWTVTFDSEPIGEQLDLATVQRLFSDSSINWLTDMNYVAVSDSTTPCEVTSTGNTISSQPNSACKPGIPDITIVADGQNGTHGLQSLVPANEDCSYGYGGYGEPGFRLGLNPTFNIIHVEYDIYFRDHTTSPDGTDFDFHSMGKPGLLALYNNPSNYWNGLGAQTMWYALVNGVQNTTARLDINNNDNGVVLSSVINSNIVQGQWYHHEMEIALATSAGNGWIKFWVNGTLVDDYENITSTAATYANRALTFGSHFGGQPPNDCAQHNSYMVFDNIHVRTYAR